MSDKFGTARPYSAAYVILRKDSKIAFVLRGNIPFMAGYYGLPSGKVEIGEPFLLAAMREAKEEIGVAIAEKDLQHALTMYRYSGLEDDGDVMEWVDIYFEAKKWDGEPYNAEPHVHDELVWLDPKDLPKNTIPYVVKALKHIEAGDSYAEIPHN
jgi:8-oxo-dGTP diphosphatase